MFSEVKQAMPYVEKLTPLYIANILADMLGMFLFGSLVMATIREKKLHTTCHLLIGFYALCGFFGKSNMLVPLLQSIIPSIGTLPFYVCVLLAFIPVPMAHCTFAMILSIGIDRLLCITNPIWYKIRNDKYYLPALFSIPLLYFCFTAYIDFGNVFEEPMRQSKCIFIASNNLILYCNLVFVLITLVCYALVAMKIYANRHAAVSIRQQIFKSLALIILIQIVAWFTSISAIIWVNSTMSTILSMDQGTQLNRALFCFISLSTSSEVAIVYFTSGDHHRAINKQFGWVFRIFSKTNNSTTNVVGANVQNGKMNVHFIVGR